MKTLSKNQKINRPAIYKNVLMVLLSDTDKQMKYFLKILKMRKEGEWRNMAKNEGKFYDE